MGNGNWILVEDNRMDCVIVMNNNKPNVVEARRLKKGDLVVIGRTENGEEGIFVYIKCFDAGIEKQDDKFSFRTRGTRETPFSRSELKVLANLATASFFARTSMPGRTSMVLSMK